MVEEEEERDGEEEMEMHSAPDGADKSRRSQLMLVYLIFLAEA